MPRRADTLSRRRRGLRRRPTLLHTLDHLRQGTGDLATEVLGRRHGPARSSPCSRSCSRCADHPRAPLCGRRGRRVERARRASPATSRRTGAPSATRTSRSTPTPLSLGRRCSPRSPRPRLRSASSASGAAPARCAVLRVDRPLRGAPPRERQLPVGQVGARPREDRQRARARRAARRGPGTTQSACSTSGAQALERRQVGVARAALAAASGSRPARGSRRRRARAPTAPRSPCRRRCGRRRDAARARARRARACPGTGSAWTCPSDSGRGRST